jgi:hypothetical protein
LSVRSLVTCPAGFKTLLEASRQSHACILNASVPYSWIMIKGVGPRRARNPYWAGWRSRQGRRRRWPDARPARRWTRRSPNAAQSPGVSLVRPWPGLVPGLLGKVRPTRTDVPCRERPRSGRRSATPGSATASATSLVDLRCLSGHALRQAVGRQEALACRLDFRRDEIGRDAYARAIPQVGVDDQPE